MKFELTLYTVLVFLVPGSLSVGVLRFWSHAVDELAAGLLSSPTAVNAALVTAAAFGLGAMVDSLRTLAIDPLVSWLGKTGTPPNYLAKLTSVNLPVFEFVLRRTHEYYRFNANTAFALLLLSVSCFRTVGLSLPSFASAAAFLLFLWGAVRQQKASFWAMERFH